MTYCASPRHAPSCVAVVADRTPLSDSSSALPGTHLGTCSLRPPFNTALLGAGCVGSERSGPYLLILSTVVGGLLSTHLPALRQRFDLPLSSLGAVFLPTNLLSGAGTIVLAVAVVVRSSKALRTPGNPDPPGTAFRPRNTYPPANPYPPTSPYQR